MIRPPIQRIHHHYERWEEHSAGMWRKATPEREAELLPRAIEFTGDSPLYGSFMRKVGAEWPRSSEHNLTDISINRRAWIGHAAVCIAIQCPEYITRLAWWQLTLAQQIAANAQADAAILEWEDRHLSTIYDRQSELCLNLD